MKCAIPEISWHNRDPILSVDIQPLDNEEFYRLASGGTDSHVLIWYLKIRKNGAVDVDVVSDLNRHQRAVNVVRWSPSGQYLATGDDDANIIIWNLKTDNIPLLEGETSDKETWVVTKVMRGHREDVYDICWSPNGMKLISGSIDNTAILWDFTKGLNECILSDHKGFVQGVAWDPKGQYIATLSSDRVCRVFDSTAKHIQARAHKGLLPVPESDPLFNKEVKYFHDDTFKSYFRRLTFSPDGNLLITPSGCIEAEGYKNVRHTTLIFTLDSLTQPAAMLPSPKQETVAVRCCPVLFELRSEGISPVITLPYRIVIAVATDGDVVLYDTQQLAPFAHLQRIHYTRITDLTWSADGLLLIASSTDGYCTLVTFELEELGVQYVKEDSEVEENLNVSGCDELDKTEAANKKSREKEQIELKPKKATILEQWAIRKPKTDILKEGNAQNVSKARDTVLLEKPPAADSEIMDVDKSTTDVQNKMPVNNNHKRIAPIKVVEANKNKKLEKVTKNPVLTNEKEKSSSPDKKTQNLVEKTIKQGTSTDDIVFVDDNCFKENKPDLSAYKRDCDSKLLPSCEKKETSAKKRKIEKSSNTPHKKSSVLLKFLQTSKSKAGSSSDTNLNRVNNRQTLNKEEPVNSVVIEISDDECSDSGNMPPKSSPKPIKNREINKTKDNKTHVTEDIIEIHDSNSNSSYNSTSSVSKVSAKTNEVVEISETTKTAVDETEKMQTDEIICTDKISVGEKRKIIQTNSSSSTNTHETSDMKTDKVTPEENITTGVEEEMKLNEKIIDNSDSCNEIEVETKPNTLQCQTEKGSTKNQENTSKHAKEPEKSDSVEQLPNQAAISKTPRRVAFVTLSSPKRKKNPEAKTDRDK